MFSIQSWSFQDQCLSRRQKLLTFIYTNAAKWLRFQWVSKLLSHAKHAWACNQVSLWKALIINSTSHPDNALRKDQTSQYPNWEEATKLIAQTQHGAQGSCQRKRCHLGSSGCPITSPIILNIPPGKSDAMQRRLQSRQREPKVQH